MKKIFSLAIISGVIVLLSSCADYHLRQGNRLFSQLRYSEAIPEYEKALKKPSFRAEVGIAESHRLMNNTVKAEESYAKVVESTQVEPIHKFQVCSNVNDKRQACCSQALAGDLSER
jgi:hypothetical protein